MKEIYFIKFIIIVQFIINLYILFKQFLYDNNKDNDEQEKFEEIDVNILYKIQKKLDNIIQLSIDEQKFLNGLIRKYKPTKIVEIGVSAGGSSAIILNAIKDIPKAKLYSIDRNKQWYLNPSKKVGWLVKKKFSELINKWTLYTGVNTAEYIESIGNKIDFVFIDTVHFTPGEMLNWLEVLPFLKEEAIVVFHDTFAMFTGNYKHKNNTNFSNNQLLCYIRGKIILPTYEGNGIFSKNIGALKLDKNQNLYYRQYFMALGNQWYYFPEENDLKVLREYFLKYYGEKMVKIYDDAVKKNRYRLK